LLKKLDAPLKFMDARLENLDALLMHWCIGGAVDAWLENLDASVVPWMHGWKTSMHRWCRGQFLIAAHATAK
jgi:hypothetical protein